LQLMGHNRDGTEKINMKESKLVPSKI